MAPSPHAWPSEDEALAQALKDHCLSQLQRMLEQQHGQTAAVVIEPVIQGAAGMIAQPQGFLREVAELARRYDTLLIADEVATGFGRTGRMFACDHETDDTFTGPDIMCLAKGLSGGYLPLAATMCTDQIEQAFTGDIGELKTLYHGHTYTGNALACAAALANLDLFESPPAHARPTMDQPDPRFALLGHTRHLADCLHHRLQELHQSPHVLDVRQRGLMVGIELCQNRHAPDGQRPYTPLDFTKRTAHHLCERMRTPPPASDTQAHCPPVFARPIGEVIMLMPAPAMPVQTLHPMLNTIIQTILDWPV